MQSQNVSTAAAPTDSFKVPNSCKRPWPLTRGAILHEETFPCALGGSERPPLKLERSKSDLGQESGRWFDDSVWVSAPTPIAQLTRQDAMRRISQRQARRDYMMGYTSNPSFLHDNSQLAVGFKRCREDQIVVNSERNVHAFEVIDANDRQVQHSRREMHFLIDDKQPWSAASKRDDDPKFKQLERRKSFCNICFSPNSQATDKTHETWFIIE